MRLLAFAAVCPGAALAESAAAAAAEGGTPHCVQVDAAHADRCTRCASGYGLNKVSFRCKPFLSGACVAGDCNGADGQPQQLSEGLYRFESTGDSYAGQWRDMGGNPVFAPVAPGDAGKVGGEEKQQHVGGQEEAEPAQFQSPWGLFHGLGSFRWRGSGHQYEGQYADGNKHGHGVFTLGGSGDVYMGEWDRDGQHGSGVFESGDGTTTYVGAWVGDEWEGRGVGTSAVVVAAAAAAGGGSDDHNDEDKDREQYAGDWRGGHRHGLGVFTFGNGVKHAGTYEADSMHGPGVATAPNGTRYEGLYQHNARHGCGRLERTGDAFAIAVEEGTWEHGRLAEPCAKPGCCGEAVLLAQAAARKAAQTERVARAGQTRHARNARARALQVAALARQVRAKLEAAAVDAAAGGEGADRQPRATAATTATAAPDANADANAGGNSGATEAPGAASDREGGSDGNAGAGWDVFGTVATLSRVYGVAVFVHFFFVRGGRE